MPSIQSERTPNPNSLKFTTADERFFHDDIVAISSKAEADHHELGKRLFEIGGIDDVFITPEFVTVSKTASTEWNAVKDDIESTLSDYLESQA
jgi:hypothetical protein